MLERAESWRKRAGRWLRARPFDLLGILLALLYALPSTFYPFGSDQGIHWYIGEKLLRGEPPYASGISGKPPGIFVVHALAIVLFGNSMAAIRWLELALLPLMGVLLARCARPKSPGRDGEIGAATLLASAVNYTYQDYWNTAHPEFFMTLCLLGALYLALHDDKPVRRALLGGVLCTAAFALKYTAAAVALPISAVCGLRALLAAEPGSRIRALVREALLFLAGALLVFVACLLPNALTGTLRELREVCWDMTVNYSRAAPEKPYWPVLWNLKRQGTLFYFAGATFASGVIVAGARRNLRELVHAGLLLVLLASAIWSVVMQGRLITYHWIATYPFLVLAASWAARQLTAGRAVLQLALAVALTAAVFLHEPRFVAKSPKSYREQVGRVLSLARGELTADQLLESYAWRNRSDRWQDILAIARAVRARAQPGDTLCLRRFVSPLYYLTGLRCTSRHAIGLFVGWGPRSWNKEYSEDLRRRPPTFFFTFTTLPDDVKTWRKRGYRELARSGQLIVLAKTPAKKPQKKPKSTAPGT